VDVGNKFSILVKKLTALAYTPVVAAITTGASRDILDVAAGTTTPAPYLLSRCKWRLLAGLRSWYPIGWHCS